MENIVDASHEETFPDATVGNVKKLLVEKLMMKTS